VPPKRLGASSYAVPTVLDLNDAVAHAASGTVEAGPKLDGVETWRLDGKLTRGGARLLAKTVLGYPSSGAQQAIARSSRIEVDVGRKDKLPRRVIVDFDFDRDAIAVIGRGQLPLESVTSRLMLDLSEWGKDISVSAPEHARPFDDFLRETGFGE
jgi:hypothetical protein